MADTQKETHDIVISGTAITGGSALAAVAPFALSMVTGVDGQLRMRAAVIAVVLAVVGTALLGVASARTEKVPEVDGFSPHYAIIASTALAGVGAILAALASKGAGSKFPPTVLAMGAEWVPVVVLVAAAIAAIVAAAKVPADDKDLEESKMHAGENAREREYARFTRGFHVRW